MKTKLLSIALAFLTIWLMGSCKKDNGSNQNLPEGALAGEFSVSATKKVHFSRGNLVATINASSAPTAWKFAVNQYDFVGENGGNVAIGHGAGDVDLFGWSTASTTYGISASMGDIDYLGEFKDWSTTIDNKGTWRTLSEAEWDYLFNNHSYKWATVNGVYGYVIAPDDYSGTLSHSYIDDSDLAKENLVFLPAAGLREGYQIHSGRNGYNGYNEIGYYWSSSAVGKYEAYLIKFDGTLCGESNYDRYFGCSVRLVTESK